MHSGRLSVICFEQRLCLIRLLWNDVMLIIKTRCVIPRAAQIIRLRHSLSITIVWGLLAHWFGFDFKARAQSYYGISESREVKHCKKILLSTDLMQPAMYFLKCCTKTTTSHCHMHYGEHTLSYHWIHYPYVRTGTTLRENQSRSVLSRWDCVYCSELRRR